MLSGSTAQIAIKVFGDDLDALDARERAEDAAGEAEGLFYPPDPNSVKICALGGNIAEKHRQMLVD